MTNEQREAIAREMAALRNAVRAAHAAASEGKLTTACHCVCGAGMGGPAGTDACRALHRISEALMSAAYSKRRTSKGQLEFENYVKEIVWWLGG